jgi:hypothetical protein
MARSLKLQTTYGSLRTPASVSVRQHGQLSWRSPVGGVQSCSRTYCTQRDIPSDASDALIDGTVRKWLHKWILGLALCPWAVGVMGDEALRIAVVRGASASPSAGQTGQATQARRMRQAFLSEASLLVDPSNAVETTLIILPGLVDFEDFLALVASLERTLERRGLDGQLQLATFHPQYQFAGTSSDDVSNYTNRSPYPVVHLLRVPAVTEAIAQVGGDTDFVWRNNIQRLQSMGIEAARKLQADIRSEGED